MLNFLYNNKPFNANFVFPPVDKILYLQKWNYLKQNPCCHPSLNMWAFTKNSSPNWIKLKQMEAVVSREWYSIIYFVIYILQFSLISLYSNYEFQMVRFLQRNQNHPVGISLHLSWLLVQCFLSSGYFCEDGWSKIEIFDIMVLYTVDNST